MVESTRGEEALDLSNTQWGQKEILYLLLITSYACFFKDIDNLEPRQILPEHSNDGLCSGPIIKKKKKGTPAGPIRGAKPIFKNQRGHEVLKSKNLLLKQFETEHLPSTQKRKKTYESKKKGTASAREQLLETEHLGCDGKKKEAGFLFPCPSD